jgi:hypothetical protein
VGDPDKLFNQLKQGLKPGKDISWTGAGVKLTELVSSGRHISGGGSTFSKKLKNITVKINLSRFWTLGVEEDKR